MAVRRQDLLWVPLVIVAAGTLGVLGAATADTLHPVVMPVLLLVAAFVRLAWVHPWVGVAGAGLSLPLELVGLPLGGTVALTPAEAAFSLVGVLYALRLALTPEQVVQPSLRDLPVWLLLVAFATGLAVAQDTFPTIRTVLIWLTYYLAYLQVQSFGRREVRLALGGLVLGGAILGAIGAFTYLTAGTTTLYGGGLVTSDRASGTFVDANYYASMLVLVTVPAVALALHRPRVNWWLGVAAALATAGIVFSLSRGGIVALGAALLMLLLYGRARAVLAGLVVVFIVLTLADANPLVESKQFETVSTRLGTIGSSDLGSTNRRPDMWALALDLGTERPLTGVGVKEFGRLTAQRGVTERGAGIENVHNVPLNFLAEQGVFGMLCFLAFAGQLAVRAARALGARASSGDYVLALGLSATLLGFALQGLTQMQLRVNVVAAGFFVVAGLLTAVADRQARSAGRRRDAGATAAA